VVRQVKARLSEGSWSWSWEKDWVWGQGSLLATISPKEGLEQVVVDHQASAALLVNRCGRRIAELATNPWGLDVFDTTQNPERHRYTGHLRDVNAPSRAWDDFDQMHARTYFPYAARFLSPDPGRDYDLSHPQSFNLYAYVAGNPLNEVDPDGQKACLANLTSEQQNELIEALNEFTGNTYGIDENGYLVLLAVGDNSSPTATAFLNNVIESDRVFVVEATSGDSRWDEQSGKVLLNLQSFVGAEYGRVNPATFNLGSTLVHELYHGFTGAQDVAPDGTVRYSLDWTGPVVDFVNVFRAERGLPLRAAYVAKKVGLKQDRERLLFQNVDPNCPWRVFYVTRKMLGR